MDYLPIFIELRARPALVVGGGTVAARKVELLKRAGAQVTVVAPQIIGELREAAQRGDIQLIGSVFEPHHLEGVTLAVAATNSREVNAAVSAAARERRIPVNVVDDPELSTFIFPAIIDRSPVVVAVGSSGHSPVLARRVRAQIEALLPARLGALARFVGDRRKEVQQTLAPEQRRPFWERIIGGMVGSRVLAGDQARADEAFQRELASTDDLRLGEVYLIGAGPGDPDLLTLRALQLLQQADVVLYDRLVSDAVLERARRDAERIFVGKEAGGDHQFTQQRIQELMIHHARLGKRVARLKGGDPFIFGRGGEEVEALTRAGIPYVVVPGITAALGAAASAGIPLTHRKLAQSVTFAAGHTLDDDSLDWSRLASKHHTVVFYMGVAQLPRIVERLLNAGASADHPAALVERASLAEQRVARGTLGTIIDIARKVGVAPPALLIVGDVASLAKNDFYLRTVESQQHTVTGELP
jgi:uroporphyrin-III C-methyltransferase/precorrin-2 dehydrogenase/sirohydrochlorin ferrochelatase